MPTAQYVIRKLLAGIPLILGVTLVSFALMVYFGPDRTYELLGKNPTPEQISEVRGQLGYDRPFVERYGIFLREIATFDFGYAATGEPVAGLLARTVPVSLALILPGFVLGHAVGLGLALLAAYWRGRPVDKLVMGLATVGMSVSFVIVMIGFQILFGSADWLGWFPVRGWSTASLGAYLEHVAVPTLATMFVAVGYDTRFYRALVAEEMNRDHVRTARAYGIPEARIFYRNILKNCLIPVITRIMFSIPSVAVGGSLLIESYFGIPGVGRATYEAIVTGDQPVLKAVVTLTAMAFVAVVILNDILYRAVDPRVSLE